MRTIENINAFVARDEGSGLLVVLLCISARHRLIYAHGYKHNSDVDEYDALYDGSNDFYRYSFSFSQKFLVLSTSF